MQNRLPGLTPATAQIRSSCIRRCLRQSISRQLSGMSMSSRTITPQVTMVLWWPTPSIHKTHPAILDSGWVPRPKVESRGS